MNGGISDDATITIRADTRGAATEISNVERGLDRLDAAGRRAASGLREGMVSLDELMRMNQRFTQTTSGGILVPAGFQKLGEAAEDASKRTVASFGMMETAGKRFLGSIQNVFMGYFTLMGVEKIASWTYESLQMRNSFEAVAGVLDRDLTGGAYNASTAIAELRRQARGTISDFDLLRTASIAVPGFAQRGIGSDQAVDQLGTIGRFSAHMGQQLRRNPAEIMQTITAGMMSGFEGNSARALREFGIVINTDVVPGLTEAERRSLGILQAWDQIGRTARDTRLGGSIGFTDRLRANLTNFRTGEMSGQSEYEYRRQQYEAASSNRTNPRWIVNMARERMESAAAADRQSEGDALRQQSLTRWAGARGQFLQNAAGDVPQEMVAQYISENYGGKTMFEISSPELQEVQAHLVKFNREMVERESGARLSAGLFEAGGIVRTGKGEDGWQVGRGNVGGFIGQYAREQTAKIPLPGESPEDAARREHDRERWDRRFRSSIDRALQPEAVPETPWILEHPARRGWQKAFGRFREDEPYDYIGQDGTPKRGQYLGPLGGFAEGMSGRLPKGGFTELAGGMFGEQLGQGLIYGPLGALMGTFAGGATAAAGDLAGELMDAAGKLFGAGEALDDAARAQKAAAIVAKANAESSLSRFFGDDKESLQWVVRGTIDSYMAAVGIHSSGSIPKELSALVDSGDFAAVLAYIRENAWLLIEPKMKDYPEETRQFIEGLMGVEEALGTNTEAIRALNKDLEMSLGLSQIRAAASAEMLGARGDAAWTEITRQAMQDARDLIAAEQSAGGGSGVYVPPGTTPPIPTRPEDPPPPPPPNNDDLWPGTDPVGPHPGDRTMRPARSGTPTVRIVFDSPAGTVERLVQANRSGELVFRVTDDGRRVDVSTI